MKNIVKISLCFLLFGAANYSFAQQSTQATQKNTTPAKKGKKQSQKTNKGIDNKIAVSDQAKPSDKKTPKAAPKQDNGISNK